MIWRINEVEIQSCSLVIYNFLPPLTKGIQGDIYGKNKRIGFF